MIPAEAVEAAELAMSNAFAQMDEHVEMSWRECAQIALEAAAPHMLADILEDAASTAETDELTTAAEVIYDLRRHAKALRPIK